MTMGSGHALADAIALVPFGDGQFRELAWRQPRAFARRWELASERGVHLVLARAGGLFLPWTARGAAGEWRIEHQPWGGATTARPESGGDAIVTILREWFAGRRVTLQDGATLHFRHDLFRARYRLEDDEGHVKVEFVREFRWFRREAQVAIEESFRGRDDLAPLLAALWRVALIRPKHGH